MTNNDSEGELARQAYGLDHVAIAVPDLEPAVAFYCDQLGCELIERRETTGETGGMASAVLRAGPISIVLVQGTSPTSQVSRYIERFGAGVQHLAIAVKDLPSVVDDLKQKGVSFNTGIIQGGGIRQAFSARDPHSGMMYEFIERQRPDGHFTDKNISELVRQMEENDAF